MLPPYFFSHQQLRNKNARGKLSENKRGRDDELWSGDSAAQNNQDTPGSSRGGRTPLSAARRVGRRPEHAPGQLAGVSAGRCQAPALPPPHPGGGRMTTRRTDEDDGRGEDDLMNDDDEEVSFTTIRTAPTDCPQKAKYSWQVYKSVTKRTPDRTPPYSRLHSARYRYRCNAPSRNDSALPRALPPRGPPATRRSQGPDRHPHRTARQHVISIFRPGAQPRCAPARCRRSRYSTSLHSWAWSCLASHTAHSQRRRRRQREGRSAPRSRL